VRQVEASVTLSRTLITIICAIFHAGWAPIGYSCVSVENRWAPRSVGFNRCKIGMDASGSRPIQILLAEGQETPGMETALPDSFD
jgi:hypothetical protein